MTRKILYAMALALIVSTASAAPIRYAEDRSPAIVNPIFATSMSEARLNELVFEGLFGDDQELRSAPVLAESLALNEDRMGGRLTLRKGVKWHDGEPFGADDVLFTIESMQNPQTASTEAGRAGWIASATKLTDNMIDLKFASEEYAPADKLHFKILPAHRFSGTTIKRTDPFRTRPIGTGPYMVIGFNDDNSITMQRSLSYWGESHIDEFIMREVADKNYQAKLLIYESLEALVRVLPRDLAALQADRKIELYPYQTNSWWYMGFNLRDPRLNDPRVREAINHMVDVEALLAPIGTGDLLSGPFVKSSPFYDHNVKSKRANPDKARSLMEAAGWTMNGRQWEKDGRPLKLRLATQQNLETAQDVVINMQAQLQNQGVIVEPVFLPVAEWKQKVWKDGDFDLILSQWSFDRNEDVYEQFHSKGTRNFVKYSNPQVDQLLDDARLAADPQEKKKLLRQVHAVVATETPMVFLWTLDSYSALSTRIGRVVVHPFYFFTWAREWEVN